MSEREKIESGIYCLRPTTEADLINMISSNDGELNLYRGQPYLDSGDGKNGLGQYSLLPTAWRKEGKEKILAVLGNLITLDRLNQLSVHEKQSLAEMYVLEQFCILANQMGLYIPHVCPFRLEFEDLTQLKKKVNAVNYGYLPSVHKMKNNNTNPFQLSMDIFISLSIAQHNGLPTRLLDWTLNPIVGLFFSLKGIDKIKEGADPVFLKLNYTKCRQRKINIDLINVVPHWTNTLLHKQSGVFTYSFPEVPGELPSIEDVIRKKPVEDDVLLEIFILDPSMIKMIEEVYNESALKLAFTSEYSSCTKEIFRKI